MELKISELDKNMNPYDNFDYNSYNEGNYWEKHQPQETQTKKKKVSFNDILSNMNLVVNKQGVLQFMTPIQQESNNQYARNEFEQPQQNYYQQPQQNYYQEHQPQQVKKNNNEPLNPAVKHSYIYNKYFKDYADTNIEKPGPRVPKTMEEYQKMLLEDKIKEIQHRKMIEQIKSKKMMFTTTPDMSINPRNIQASKNNLRMMNFR
jgi:hypothetical protein